MGLEMADAVHQRPLPESPIEVVFKLWWEVVSRADWWTPWDWCQLNPQVTVKLETSSYRLDFQVACGDLGTQEIARRYRIAPPLIGVELDGHDFHERTKEQVTLRNKRDRDLQAAGWKVFHFSGSELLHEPLLSAYSVWDYSRRAGRDFTLAALRAFEKQGAEKRSTGNSPPAGGVAESHGGD